MNILDQSSGEGWSLYNADCVELASSMPDNSIDLSVYSPPFANLYIYSDSVADMGNCADDTEFFEQYKFLIREKLRVTVPRASNGTTFSLPGPSRLAGPIRRRCCGCSMWPSPVPAIASPLRQPGGGLACMAEAGRRARWLMWWGNFKRTIKLNCGHDKHPIPR